MKQNFLKKTGWHPARDLKKPATGLQLSVCPWPNNHWKGKDHSPGGYQNADLQVSYKASLSPERTETSCVVQKVSSFWRLHTKMTSSNVNRMSGKIPLHFASVQPALGFKIKLLKGDHRFRTKVHPSVWLPKKVIIERIICQKMSPPHPMPFTSMVLLMCIDGCMIESHDSTGEFNKPTYLQLESEKFTGICLPNRLDHHSLLVNVCPNPPVLPSSHSAHAKSQGLPQFPPRTPTWRCKTIWITHKKVVSASQKTGRPNKKITCEECSRTSQQNASNSFLTFEIANQP